MKQKYDRFLYLILSLSVSVSAWPFGTNTTSLLTNQIEVGDNDFRISTAGGDINPLTDATHAAVAYNSHDHEYLVVWQARDGRAPGDLGPLIQVYGQRIDATTGEEIGQDDFLISNTLGTPNPILETLTPAVAYNSQNNEYLVVWRGNDQNVPGIIANEYEIFAQRLDASGQRTTTANDLRISDAGGSGDTSSNVGNPAVIFNTNNNEYLVVWQAVDLDVAGLDNGEEEIFGQRIDGDTGQELGDNDFRISDAGGTGNRSYDATDAALAYNSENNEYLVVWQADDRDVEGIVNGAYEIYGQRLDGSSGSELGENDFRISDASITSRNAAQASKPDVAYNPTDNEYLVVWVADDRAAGLINNEFEIFGQRLDASSGTEIGDNDFRISDVGGTRNTNFQANNPAVAYLADLNEYLVIWDADDIDTPGIINGEFEIFGQRLDASSGTETGINDFRISDVGGDGDTTYGPDLPAIASGDDEYLVIWQADDPDANEIADNELEIFGQRIKPNPLVSTADLAISKTNQRFFLEDNEIAIYTIIVENLGPEDVTGATVVDLLPDTLDVANTVWTCVADPGAQCTVNGNQNILDTIDLPAGLKVSYTLTTTVIADDGDLIINTATVTPPTTPVDPNPGNNTATDSDSVALFADGFEG